MMNGAAEKTVLTQAVPGQRGTRQMPGARTGADQLMADFEGLLVKHSMVQEQVPEQAATKTSDNHVEKSPRATPEALFLALAGGAELAASDEDAEQPQLEDESGDDSTIAETEDKPPQPAAIRAETPALVIAAAAPRIQAEPGEAKPTIKEEAAPKLKAAPADAARAMVASVEDDAPIDLPPASPDNASSQPDADRPVVAEKRAAKVAEDPPVAEKPSKSQDGAPPVTLIRVAGQETHFAPSPVVVFDDQRIGNVPLGAPTEIDAPGRAQPVAPPVTVKAPGGPLRTLKVDLGSHELGMINATVALKDKALDLKIGAARDDAVASLRENVGRLSDALQALGYSVDAVSVQKMQQSDAGTQAGNGQPQQDAGNQDAGNQDARGQGQQRPSGGSGSGSENSSGQSRYAHRDDHLAEQERNDHAKSTAGSRDGRGVFL